MKNIIQTLNYNEKYLYLFDWMEYNTKPIRNIECFNMKNKLLWKISPLTNISVQTDFWTNMFVQDGKLFANNFEGLLCEIDLNTGNILSSKFVK